MKKEKKKWHNDCSLIFFFLFKGPLGERGVRSCANVVLFVKTFILKISDMHIKTIQVLPNKVFQEF